MWEQTVYERKRLGRDAAELTNDMLHTVLRRRALGESVEQVQPNPFIPTGKRKGQNTLAAAQGGPSPKPGRSSADRHMRAWCSMSSRKAVSASSVSVGRVSAMAAR